jgi:hypothetical protein
MKKQIAATTFLVLLILSLTLTTNPVSSQDTTVVYVDPVAITQPSGTQFTLTIGITDVVDLTGFDVKLGWDPTVLNYVSHTTSPANVLNPTVFTVADIVDPAAGTYQLAAATLGGAGFTGSGTIYTVTLQVLVESFSDLELLVHDLADSIANPIPNTAVNGTFGSKPPVDMYVSPNNVIDADLTPSHNFTVGVHADNLIGLRDLEFWLGYNTTTLDIAEVVVHPAFAAPTVEISEPAGTLRVSGTASPSVTGDGIMANVTFHVTGIGETILDLYNVTLIDDGDDPIPYNTPGDGFFSNVLKARLFVSPPEIIDPTMTPGTMFSIDIQVDDVFDLYGYSFSLSYGTDVLTCIGLAIIPPNADPHFTTDIAVDDALGEISVTVGYYTPAPSITLLSDTTIVTVYFMVQGYGCTPLDLHDTLLTNPLGDPITHEVGDGFFCTLIADVAIVWMEPSSNYVYPGRPVNITVVAANLGDVTSTFNVTAYYDNTTIGIQTVVDLLPDHNTTLVFVWDTTGLTPCNNFTLSAYASPVPYELDFTNNYYASGGWVKIKILGDVNSDGTVDIFDLVLASDAYGSQDGDPNYNPEADIAPHYGLVDIFDLVTIASHYGEGC